YSLGATFFFLITGSPPYTGETIYEILRKKTEYECLDPEGALEGESFPDGIRDIIRRMTALQPKDRYPSFEDLILDIDRYLQGKRVGLRSASTWPLKLAALLLVAGGLSGAAYYLGWLDEWLRALGSAPEAVVNPVHPVPPQSDPQPGAPGPGTPPSGPEQPTPRIASRDLLAGEIGRLRLRRQDCGDSDLHSDAQKLLASLTVGEHPELEAELRSISADARRLRDVQAELSNLSPPKTLGPPFTELAAHWKDISERLKPPETAGDDLKRCLAAEASRRGEELMQRAESSSREASRVLELRLGELREWKLATADHERQVDGLEDARRTLLAAFPAGRGRWDGAIPETTIAELRAEISTRREVEKESRALLDSVHKLQDLFKPLAGLSDWTRGGSKRAAEELGKVDAALERLRKQEPRLPLAEHEAGLREARALEKRWTERAGAFARALESVEARRLAETGKLLQG
ncbi:MAG: hypothetical protein ACRD2T_15495, partial [Thermoanaerobaculia bacterium]